MSFDNIAIDKNFSLKTALPYAQLQLQSRSSTIIFGKGLCNVMIESDSIVVVQVIVEGPNTQGTLRSPYPMMQKSSSNAYALLLCMYTNELTKVQTILHSLKLNKMEERVVIEESPQLVLEDDLRIGQFKN